jgi:hypothetical protein
VEGLTQPLLPVGSVTVTKSATTTPGVEVASVPATLTVGATLLGREVQLINGTTLMLSGSADANISASTSKPFLPYEPYYYSPHAGKVFATQAGRVIVTWVSNLPDTSAGGESTATYKFKTEVFSVASSPSVPQRPQVRLVNGSSTTSTGACGATRAAERRCAKSCPCRTAFMARAVDGCRVRGRGPVRATIEVAGGTAERLNLRVGDRVLQRIFGNAP